MGWDEDLSFRKNLKNTLAVKNRLLRGCLAEFLGTFVLIIFGCGSVAQYKLFDGLGSYATVNWGWGIAVAMGVWACGGVSGGHINPAVSLAMWLLGRIPFLTFLLFMLAQYAGAIVASAVIFGVYEEAIENYEGLNRTLDTAGIWATYPQDFVGAGTCFFDQVVGTSMLVLCVFAVTDKNNQASPSGMAPLCVGLSVVAIGMTLGSNCGYAINPARDLGPRIFTAMAGWGDKVFSFRDYNYFWIPVVGPHVGAVAGAWLYLAFVGIHAEHAAENGEDEDGGYNMEEKLHSAHGDSMEMNGKDNVAYI